MFNLQKNECQVQIHADSLDPNAAEQIKLIASHPALHGLISIMPDAHAGAGCVIGFTGMFKNAVIPNIVGVDIGCGVACHPLEDVQDIDFPALDRHIREKIPLGMNWHEGSSHLDQPDVPPNLRKAIVRLCEHIEDGFYKENKVGKHIQAVRQIGTLGGGNHFIEIGQDREGGYHLIIHSGSRNLGKRVAEFFQEKATKVTQEMGVRVPKGQEFLPLSAGGDQYMKWAATAQTYARYNRRMMLIATLAFFGVRFDEKMVIESVHNYISEIDNIIRKGAISAHKDERVIIPLNMADGTILGTGKGNKAYNLSAPHGAGRKHGRMDMFRRLDKGEFSMEKFHASMQHVYSTSLCRETFDESKFAYKPFSDIEQYLLETVEITGKLTPVYNLKAAGE